MNKTEFIAAVAEKAEIYEDSKEVILSLIHI